MIQRRLVIACVFCHACGGLIITGKNAEKFAVQAIEVLSNQPSSPIKAMAFSNMSQLKMLFDQYSECIAWGEKAITLARKWEMKKRFPMP
jgi:hypothetical protein